MFGLRFTNCTHELVLSLLLWKWLFSNLFFANVNMKLHRHIHKAICFFCVCMCRCILNVFVYFCHHWITSNSHAWVVCMYSVCRLLELKRCTHQTQSDLSKNESTHHKMWVDKSCKIIGY